MREQERCLETAAVSPGARVLVSGASFAGLATAYWMHRLGYAVTVVEIADDFRKGGTPVDIKQGTIDIVRRMGLLDAIRAKSLPPRRTEFKNAADVTEALLPGQPVAKDGPNEQYEIDRDDLLEIMFDAVRGKIELVFGRSVLRLDANADGVSAWFNDGSRQEFALVFGCDGTRSNIRRLVFDAADGGSIFLNRYFLLKVVPKTIIESNVTQIFSTPGRTVMLNGYDGKTDIALSFYCDDEIPYDHRDKAQQKRLIRERFEGVGWRVPELLTELDADDQFYFDQVCQVRMATWSKGRVALVGDAGYCPSPAAGMGGSMAIVGAAALADAFRRHGGDVAAAFADYDETLRPFVERVQDEAVNINMPMFAPQTEAAIAERNRLVAEMAA